MVSVISRAPSKGENSGTFSNLNDLFFRVTMLMVAKPTMPKAGRLIVLLLTGFWLRDGTRESYNHLKLSKEQNKSCHSNKVPVSSFSSGESS
jgi:hypothetical protein